MIAYDILAESTGADLLVAALLRRHETIACAESLTAGLASAALAGIPGVSDALRGGVVVYSTDAKHILADVPQEILDAEGAVSAGTAELMAGNIRKKLDATWGLSLTGVAGPDPQEGVLPGTVYVGVSGPGVSRSKKLALQGDRWNVRLMAVARAFGEVLIELSEERV
ncbi:CinA family protein [Hoyosella altamirensis]|uniref:Nicotinamide-nucleotide amidase n=1 Tax=Hoyosella altamirensis TaxID=616997 RepID=A0A839RNZ0_9ACTN|nr:CinA family protein [Hoyosella altamirensis]MBB3038505.1 nicotinamide-nucleotide amidase [Hoyosella altamirensis]